MKGWAARQALTVPVVLPTCVHVQPAACAGRGWLQGPGHQGQTCSGVERTPGHTCPLHSVSGAVCVVPLCCVSVLRGRIQRERVCVWWPLLAAFCCIFSAWTHTFVREPVVLFCCLVHAPCTTSIHCAKQTFLTLSEVEVVGNVGDIPKRSPVSSVVCGNSVTSTYLSICVQSCALEHIRNTPIAHIVSTLCVVQSQLRWSTRPPINGKSAFVWLYVFLSCPRTHCCCCAYASP